MEPVREVNGVLWVNDSKATNIASTSVALEAMDRPYVLLLGGRHKGEPYTALADHMKGRCKAVVAFGEAGDTVERDLKGKIKVVRAGAFPRRCRQGPKAGPGRGRGAALAGLLQLRHVPQL